MDYAQLQQSVADFLNRNDLSGQIQTFIRLAEAQMQREIRTWWGVAPQLHGGIGVDPEPDLVPLSGAAPTNWLLARAPDAYLYGSLMASAPFLIEDERLAVWSPLYVAAMDKLREENEWLKNQGPLVMRSPQQRRELDGQSTGTDYTAIYEAAKQ